MDNKYLLILIVLAVICFAIFFYQLSHDVNTFIVINETEATENGTIHGFLMDAYSRGVPNKTVYYHRAGDNSTTLLNVTTDGNGMFTIENIRNVPDSGNNNYYGNFSFKGDNEFNPCTYEHNIVVK
ncbi:hypothetical protein [Methanobrevibacter sp.]|uniref:hypothetical protein n=1 Tax=Methanobrevibacter sp. TaxID=66852 RepID=UPI00388EA096